MAKASKASLNPPAAPRMKKSKKVKGAIVSESALAAAIVGHPVAAAVEKESLDVNADERMVEERAAKKRKKCAASNPTDAPSENVVNKTSDAKEAANAVDGNGGGQKKSSKSGDKVTAKETFEEKDKRKQRNRMLRETYATDPSSLSEAAREEAAALQKVFLATEAARAKQQQFEAERLKVEAAGFTLEAAESSNSLKRKKSLRKNGDWDCKSCGSIVFANKWVCFKCKAARPEEAEATAEEAAETGDAGRGKGKGKTRLAGDWDCVSCGKLNFMSRTTCFKCNTHKLAKETPGAVDETQVSSGRGGRGRGNATSGRGRGH